MATVSSVLQWMEQNTGLVVVVALLGLGVALLVGLMFLLWRAWVLLESAIAAISLLKFLTPKRLRDLRHQASGVKTGTSTLPSLLWSGATFLLVSRYKNLGPMLRAAETMFKATKGKR